MISRSVGAGGVWGAASIASAYPAAIRYTVRYRTPRRPQLPPLLLRPAGLGPGDVAADGGAGVAGPAAHAVGLGAGHHGGPAGAARPPPRTVGRRGRRPRRQAP